MSYMEKSTENENAAKILCDNKFYNAAISRYYYSILQLITNFLKEKNIKIKEEDIRDKGSHDKVINSLNEYIKPKGVKYLKKAHSMRSKFYQIKAYRVKADYSEENSNENDVKQVKSIYNSMKDLLNSI